mmetsp:Transcript_24695/g.77429  ORF Transcript_24695/g.77429 Transcript_24695/m.77429 type:complete len:308 (+) Transcript_24695:345-1268(+)
MDGNGDGDGVRRDGSCWGRVGIVGADATCRPSMRCSPCWSRPALLGMRPKPPRMGAICVPSRPSLLDCGAGADLSGGSARMLRSSSLRPSALSATRALMLCRGFRAGGVSDDRCSSATAEFECVMPRTPEACSSRTALCRTLATLLWLPSPPPPSPSSNPGRPPLAPRGRSDDMRRSRSESESSRTPSESTMSASSISRARLSCSRARRLLRRRSRFRSKDVAERFVPEADENPESHPDPGVETASSAMRSKTSPFRRYGPPSSAAADWLLASSSCKMRSRSRSRSISITRSRSRSRSRSALRSRSS